MVWDVIVVGAGVEGSATAYNLVKSGYKTLLVEQFPLPHVRGSSHGHSRITRKAYPEDFYCKMMVEGYDVWKQLAKEENVQLFIPTGLLSIDKNGSEILRDTEISLQSINADFEKLDSVGIKKKFPMMSLDDSYSALFDPEGGMLLADKCLRAFQNQFKANGGVLQDGETVLKIVPSDKEVQVTTTRGVYSGKSVVITVGPWTNRMLQHLDLQLPIKVLRVIVWYWKQLEKGYSIKHGFPTFIWHDGEEEIFGLPSYEYPGLTKIAYHGGHQIENPDFRDSAPGDDRYLRYTSEFVKRHMPGLEPQPSVAENCIYSVTPDTNFIIDQHPKWKNIIIGAGFSGHGFKLSPIVGKLLAELATGRKESFDLNPFRISRFKEHQNKSKM